jgi:hypothetical protein
VLRILNIKLEASCTTSANEASSRLFLVETTFQHKSFGNGKEALNKRPTAVDIGYFSRAMDYFQARRSLGHFRRYHSHLQEEEIGAVITEIEGDTRPLDILKLDVFACSVYVLIWLLGVLVRQRFPEKAAKWLPDGLPAHSHLRGLFVFCHGVAYYLLGTKMLHSSRAAGMISLYSLTEYVVKLI